MIESVLHILTEIWLVTAEMGPWLLLGFLVAGLLSVFISPVWLERHLGGRGAGPVFKASLFGVPLPLCSCGVIPVAASLRAHGASRGATTAFLLSTPQTGVDSILVTYSMLGPLFAIFRPVIALVTGFLGGGMVQMADEVDGSAAQSVVAAADERPRGLVAKVQAALDYGLVTLPADIARALLVGVVIAGVLAAVVPEDFLARYLGTGPLSIALMMAVGIPIYVCATASVPLAAGFIFLGASPGAALAFLVAGPATNAATMTTVARVLGRRTMFIYLLTVAASAFGGGLLLDWLLPRASNMLPVLGAGGHHHQGLGWFDHLAGVLLLLVMVRSWWLARQRDCGCDAECATTPARQELELVVEGMNCSHCSGSVQRALSELPGVVSCRVSLEDGRARITGEDLDRKDLTRAVTGLGYKVVEAMD
ncbi:heavy metal-associated domain-containing protein [bacterium]|nr:MAG: heavy metal-associated domain-containing protein [bacterium]